VTYQWIRTDNRGSTTVPEAPINLAAGDTASHALVADRWTPNSAGTEQLVFLGAGAPAMAVQAFTCR